MNHANRLIYQNESQDFETYSNQIECITIKDFLR